VAGGTPTLRAAGGLAVYVQCVAGSAGAAAAGEADAVRVGRGVAEPADAGLPPPCRRKYAPVPSPAAVQQTRAMIPQVRQRLERCTRLACWRS
ncbi:MAG TPA: hypothetical protein VEG33_09595, partial [Streptosporangiaceae bacterium]|nr:hypothetical protein [Streptosporangiaceae bacterium]